MRDANLVRSCLTTHLPLELEDRQDAERHFRNLMRSLGVNMDTEHTKDTPRRFVGMMEELFGFNDQGWNLTTFAATSHDIVIVRDIPFISLCAHHFALFEGTADIAYVPGDLMVGLSKLARVLQTFARGPNVQETIGYNVAEYLDAKLSPAGVMVVLRARHSCMTARGVKAHGTETITSHVRGVFESDVAARAEVLSLLKS